MMMNCVFIVINDVVQSRIKKYVINVEGCYWLFYQINCSLRKTTFKKGQFKLKSSPRIKRQSTDPYNRINLPNDCRERRDGFPRFKDIYYSR